MSAWPLAESAARLLLGGAVAWTIASLWSHLLAALWRRGRDRGRALAHTHAPLRLTVGALALAFASPTLELPASPGGLALTLALLLVLAIAGANTLRDILAGLALSLRRPFTLGDQVSTEELAGQVVSLGLTRVGLRAPGGALITVPTRELVSRPLTTSADRRRALPIEVQVQVPGGADLMEALRRLRDEAYLSAYVDVAAPVSCELAEPRSVTVYATPLHPDDAGALRADLIARAADLSKEAG